MTTTPQSMRDEFEAYLGRIGFDVTAEFAHTALLTQAYWEIWQAATRKEREAIEARIAALPPLPPLDTRLSIPYESIRYLAGYHETEVHAYTERRMQVVLAAIRSRDNTN